MVVNEHNNISTNITSIESLSTHHTCPPKHSHFFHNICFSYSLPSFLIKLFSSHQIYKKPKFDSIFIKPILNIYSNNKRMHYVPSDQVKWSIILHVLFTACPSGSFGPECRGTCTCGQNFICDHVTGECRCKPGLKGKKCKKGGYYYGAVF